MKNLFVFLPVILLVALTVPLRAGEDAKLKKVIAADHRSEKNKARDVYRHPYETLKFFGIEKNMTVVEVWPGGGWYTDVLGPYLKDSGTLITALYDRNPESQEKWMARVNKGFEDNYVSKPETYGHLTLSEIVLPGSSEVAPAGSVDMVLDFRNAHNWIQMGAEDMVKSWHKALKKGGIVGLIDHRMDDDKAYNPKNGYVHEKQIVEIMEKHGFKLAARSDINANAKDSKDHPRGVWTLPPSLAKKEEGKEKYLAIGESDRMTLKFVKQ